ncbi:hypothetical protein ACTOV4_16405 [Brucella sp. C7-11G]
MNKPTAAADQDNKPTIDKMIAAAKTDDDLREIEARLLKEIADVSVVMADMNHRWADFCATPQEAISFQIEMDQYKAHRDALNDVYSKVWKRRLFNEGRDMKTVGSFRCALNSVSLLEPSH